MSILTDSGRQALAATVAAQPIHLVMGGGDPAWDADYVPEDPAATGVVDELGWLKVLQVLHVAEDAAGDIYAAFAPDQAPVRYAASETPTGTLCFRFLITPDILPAATLREYGVVMGAATDPALPPGQMYFDPAQITGRGTLLLLEHPARMAGETLVLDPILRSPTKSTTINLVMDF